MLQSKNNQKIYKSVLTAMSRESRAGLKRCTGENYAFIFSCETS